MSTGLTDQRYLDRLGIASRRAALLSIVAVTFVIGSMVFAALQLRRLEEQKDALLTQQRQLEREIEDTRGQLRGVQRELDATRCALETARAAISAFHLRRYEDAVKQYDQALRCNPEDAYLLNLRAYALFKAGRIEAAVEGQKRSIQADPNYAWGYFDMARFRCAQQPPQFEEALDAARQAIRLRPGMKNIMLGDGEFRRLCEQILSRLPR